MNLTRPLIALFVTFLANMTPNTWAALVEASEDTILTNRGGGPFTIGFDFSVDVAPPPTPAREAPGNQSWKSNFLAFINLPTRTGNLRSPEM